ncbi:MAG: hypothetical protein LV479_06515 [Methylacidiphilales bacterium]|nr:hypothetical protein [Candidatus Methylacidiphilales bacterium]
MTAKDPSFHGNDQRGVYTLANDVVIEWFEAFARSFRRMNPDMPLTVIPYNSATGRLRKLTGKYRFTLMEEAACAHFDSLEKIVMDQGRSAAMFRKWACFFGPYSDFIFLDADIVVSIPLDEILDAFVAASLDFIYFDVDLTMVYRPEAVPGLMKQYGSVGFNAGAFVSRKGVVSEEGLIAFAHEAASHREKFVIDQVDQPFLNYFFDTTGRRIACVDQLLPHYASVAWARQPFTYDWKKDVARNAKGKVMPFIHWPGCVFPTMVRPEVFLRHRTIGDSTPTRVGYYIAFYFLRGRAKLAKVAAHWRVVLTKFFTNSAWRKYYLCRLMGIKTELPA